MLYLINIGENPDFIGGHFKTEQISQAKRQIESEARSERIFF